MISFILLAGGSGSRMEKSLPKQFLTIAGKPMIIHIMEKIEKIDEIVEIIVTYPEGYKDYILDYIDKWGFTKKYVLTKGGESRQESVYNALKQVRTDTVIIHEAARPFVRKSDFYRLINCSKSNTTYAASIPFTVLERNGDYISSVLDRSKLVNIQLPQKFDYIKLMKAHELAHSEGLTFTEDASMLYQLLKERVSILEGPTYNIKITTNTDYIAAEEIYKEYMVNME